MYISNKLALQYIILSQIHFLDFSNISTESMWDPKYDFLLL